MIILQVVRTSESIVLIILLDLTFVKVGLGVEADFCKMLEKYIYIIKVEIYDFVRRNG